MSLETESAFSEQFRSLYTAISVNIILFVNQSFNMSVRHLTAQHADHDSLLKFTTDLQTDVVWVNESGIVATDDFLQRDIHACVLCF